MGSAAIPSIAEIMRTARCLALFYERLYVRRDFEVPLRRAQGEAEHRVCGLDGSELLLTLHVLVLHDVPEKRERLGRIEVIPQERDYPPARVGRAASG